VIFSVIGVKIANDEWSVANAKLILP